MQRATITGIRVRSPADARVIFHAVLTGVLPMVTRRLDTEERSLITTGSVYVWEERGPHAELTGVSSSAACFVWSAHVDLQVGIERWTDGTSSKGPAVTVCPDLFRHRYPLGSVAGARGSQSQACLVCLLMRLFSRGSCFIMKRLRRLNCTRTVCRSFSFPNPSPH